MFNIKIPVLALADSFMVAFNDTSEIAAWHADHVWSELEGKEFLTFKFLEITRKDAAIALS